MFLWSAEDQMMPERATQTTAAGIPVADTQSAMGLKLPLAAE